MVATYNFGSVYVKCYINCLDRSSTCGQRYGCDLQKNKMYFFFY